MVSNVEYKSEHFLSKSEELLNSAQAFNIVITELNAIKVIKKYSHFFRLGHESQTVRHLSLKFNFIGKTKISDFYLIYLIALQYAYRVSLHEEDQKLKVMLKPTSGFNRFQFFSSIERSTFPVIEYPSKKFYDNAKAFCEHNKYLVIRVSRLKDIESTLIESLVKQNVVETIKIIYPIYLKMFLDYITQILNWNVIFYVEKQIMYVLCTSLTSDELRLERKK